MNTSKQKKNPKIPLPTGTASMNLRSQGRLQANGASLTRATSF